MPILEGTDGVQKMSKSYGNYIGISEPPQEIYGKVMSISDALMWRYYELLTDVKVAEIEQMKADAVAGKQHPMELKKALARRIVQDFHGEAAAKTAELGESSHEYLRSRLVSLKRRRPSSYSGRRPQLPWCPA
jgi:tyrosyl-tRNA synthetase